MKAKDRKALFSSKSGEWETPQKLFDYLNSVYHFTLDACATKRNAKCKQYFSRRDDALKREWPGRVFMNPPYGRGIDHWIAKAYREATEIDSIVVCLIPARTDTRYWHTFVMKASEIYFVAGRLKFSKSKNSAPFPSAVVVFRRKKTARLPCVYSLFI